MLYNIIGWGVEKVISLAGSGMVGRDGDEGEEGRYWFPIVMGVPNSQMIWDTGHDYYMLRDRCEFSTKSGK